MALHYMVEHFKKNERGRDFAVGDIHGCFHLLKMALESYEFNPQVDRLFAVGDLIDRGPYSSQVLEWLSRPWFNSCLGNHEEMILRSLQDQTHCQKWFLANGGDWWLKANPSTRHNILSTFSALPTAMEIETEQGIVGIVHADIPKNMTWKTFNHYLSMGDEECYKTALWSRRRALGEVRGAVKGVDFVICGHSVSAAADIRIQDNVWFIDTGAYLQNGIAGLTILPLDALYEN